MNDEMSSLYKCSPQIEFSHTFSCELPVAKRQHQPAPLPDNLIKDSDNKILYAYKINKEEGGFEQVLKKISTTAAASLGEEASKKFTLKDAKVLIWGDAKLEKIATSSEEYDEIKGRFEQKYGLLISPNDNFKGSDDDRRPVYRVVGGDGLIIIISQESRGQILVQRAMVAAGTLAERNFESQARQFFEADRTAPSDDLSKWSEIAFMVRRLALNTTPDKANRIVDEIFRSAPIKKYHSHAWAVLPTSVINHLKMGTYRAVDVFGEKTEFPEIRDQIMRQLKLEPGDNFSEFLLYSLGRFREALEAHPGSPIHSVLAYSLGHSMLRGVLTNTYKRLSKSDDDEIFSIYSSNYSYLAEVTYNINIENEDSYYPEDKHPYKEPTIEEKYKTLATRSFFDGYYNYALTIPDSQNEYRDGGLSLSQCVNYFNQFPERYDSKPLCRNDPSFISHTNDILKHFKEVLKDQKSPHFDDASYLLGWLEYHRGNIGTALESFEPAIKFMKDIPSEELENYDHNDYSLPAIHQVARILGTLSPEDAFSRVQKSKVLSGEPDVWNSVLTSFYHAHQYRTVMDGAKRALDTFGIKIESLPVTTDPKRIEAILKKFHLEMTSLGDVIYLYHSSREIGQIEDMLKNPGDRSPSAISAKVKEIVVKYALTDESDFEKKSSRQGPTPKHKDLRQSIYIARRSLDLLPKTPDYSKLRQWLYYKQIRLLAQFDPIKVAAANLEFGKEFPSSPLLDDVLAEQIFAESVIVGDMAKAVTTFDALRRDHPRGNAIDNAYSWMAIGWTCAGQPAKARQIDKEIIRLFLFTRHARYARERIQNPSACEALYELFKWELEAMNWRQRNRIDIIQSTLKANDSSSAEKLR
ncbi:hypothetical protein IYW40_12060 [Methylocystis sp. H4A]|nr:hypothetical protein [Methylocystis sp. H4A]